MITPTCFKQFIFVGFSQIEKLDIYFFVSFAEVAGDIFGHRARPVPHVVVNKGDLIFPVVAGPFPIFLNKLFRFVPPDDTVACTNNVEVYIKV